MSTMMISGRRSGKTTAFLRSGDVLLRFRVEPKVALWLQELARLEGKNETEVLNEAVWRHLKRKKVIP